MAAVRGPGMMGPGIMGPGVGMRVMPIRHLSADDPRRFLEHRLGGLGCKRLVVGSVEEKDEDTMVAQIVTAKGAVVQELEVDRHSGFVKPGVRQTDGVAAARRSARNFGGRLGS